MRETVVVDGAHCRFGLTGDMLGDLHPATVRQLAAALLAAVDRVEGQA